MHSLEWKLKKLEDDYSDAIYTIAKEEFERVVKPYCIRKGCDFTAGNGAYLFSRDEIGVAGRLVVIDLNDDLPKYILKVVDEPVPNWDGNSIGTVMPSFENPNIYHGNYNRKNLTP